VSMRVSGANREHTVGVTVDGEPPTVRPVTVAASLVPVMATGLGPVTGVMVDSVWGGLAIGGPTNPVSAVPVS